MSAGRVSLRTQVESVLSALVRAATAELTELFESRYRASALDVDVNAGRTGDRTAGTLGSLSTGDSKRSIGVQVDEDVYLPQELCAPALLSDGNCLGATMEEQKEVVDSCLIPSELLLTVENGLVDPEWAPLKEQIVAETLHMVKMRSCEGQSAADTDPHAEIVLHVSAATLTEAVGSGSTQGSPTKQESGSSLSSLTEQENGSTKSSPTKQLNGSMKSSSTEQVNGYLKSSATKQVDKATKGSPTKQVDRATKSSPTKQRNGSTQSSPTKQVNGTRRNPPSKNKPLVIQPDTRYIISGESLKFVCPLIITPEPPAPRPDSSEKPEQAENRQACVSTVNGTTHSPSLSDGAVTPTLPGVWERIYTPKDAKGDLHMKLKLTSPDQKLTRPCAVQLVDMFAVPGSSGQVRSASATSPQGNPTTGWPMPKDLRQHQGLHTGHRLCCFTPSENGVWRLKKVVSHSRDGYLCNVCQKTFQRRKILRRHERFHTGEKPYPCPDCQKTFALRKSLRRHLRFHTGERPHICTQCNKSFRLRENLKAHLRFHTGEKPFSCSTCGKLFRIMRNLEKHKCEFFVPSFRTIAGF